MRYKFKRGHSPDITRVARCLEECFPCEVQMIKEKCILSYGAIERMEVWLDGKALCVETTSNKNASDEQVLDTNRRFRQFLTKATGYTTKERIKQAKKEVEGA
ncbi:DUF5611 family protein [Methermicoccus shengliensis]|uniref:DUF5611 family protein n=1 Tax=Methermicoccus shengliensis TaxID=660064 RepID=A0A832VWS7_9EURY|nr:DUF5611 family protein [Methermicoccus shengliensis]KUK04615.1 MAG: Uncharacterized protein XD46_0592 [Euryarchaeota archaeon 55_53]KUK30742.1 MAG: Uncharacterized protein XD62_0120 [Methanosarcinales archeaon 56_1174]MDI3488496.1 hypothetical protein [Methanosarcinales archaeon]MDN5295129.1 hypothetical protein [Methanosarcinales archaeon]HIH69153.1 DUF5611 family protein [Methermicoccus shengliensis]